jgi:hypothetical protein
MPLFNVQWSPRKDLGLNIKLHPSISRTHISTPGGDLELLYAAPIDMTHPNPPSSSSMVGLEPQPNTGSSWSISPREGTHRTRSRCGVMETPTRWAFGECSSRPSIRWPWMSRQESVTSSTSTGTRDVRRSYPSRTVLGVGCYSTSSARVSTLPPIPRKQTLRRTWWDA